MTRSARILIVEDNVLVAKFYRLALERAGGFECVVSEDVPAILAQTGAGEFDCAILDVTLGAAAWEGRPIDGVRLTRLLKQRSPRPLPVILATAHAMPGERDRLLAESGADAYLQKPVYEADALVKQVQELIAGRAAS
jgi:CheY-like chemotaxis protein